MNRPQSIRIMGIDYHVRYVDRKCDVDSDDRSALFGQITYDRCEIVVATCRREELIDATILHEIIHAVDRHLRIGVDEEMVERLAEGLAQVMHDNGGRLVKEQ